jgi:hypothetical protein
MKSDFEKCPNCGSKAKPDSDLNCKKCGKWRGYDSVRKRLRKDRFKKVASGLWEFLVFFAYVKFYAFCFMGVMLSLVCSIWILNEAGRDITQIAGAVRYIGYSALFFIAVILVNKIKELFQKGRD